MPRIKLPRNSPSIDMTPMVDLGFLLVTFFMLTTQFRADEPVQADTPSSVSEVKIPEKDMMVLTVDKENRVFYTFDGQEHRKSVLLQMGEKYNQQFTEEEAATFSNITSFGVPMANMKDWLKKEGSARKDDPAQKGIPMDSLHNELYDWLYFSRMANNKYRVAIKGDRLAEYKTIKEVIAILGEVKVYKFNLVTDMKTE